HAFVNNCLKPADGIFAYKGMRTAWLTKLQSLKLIQCFIPIIMGRKEDIRAGALRDTFITLGRRAPSCDTFDFSRIILDSIPSLVPWTPTPKYTAHMPLVPIFQ